MMMASTSSKSPEVTIKQEPVDDEEEVICCDDLDTSVAGSSDVTDAATPPRKRRVVSSLPASTPLAVPCHTCSAVFTSQTQLDEHVAARHPSFNCKYCGKSCRARANVRRHELSQRCMRVKDKCKSCSKKLFAPSALNPSTKPDTLTFLMGLGRTDTCAEKCQTLHECCFCKLLFIGEKRMTDHVEWHLVTDLKLPLPK